MKIFSLTLCHKVFPIELREKIAFKDADAISFLSGLKEEHEIKNALLVSTCNRTELFIAAENVHQGLKTLEQVLDVWERERNFKLPICPPPNIIDHYSSVERLLRVTSGLESQIVGESEIQGQVRTAMDLSAEAGVNGQIILKLWEKALRCGKRVRSETPLGDGALSVAYGALEVARKIFGGISNLDITIVGAGEVSELVLQNLQGQDRKSLKILNRSKERAEHLARSYSADLGGLEDLPSALINSDLVIASTGASDPVITRQMIKDISSKRKKGALLLVDLGLPRDIEPTIGNLADIFLFNLDDLARLVEGNLTARRQAIPEAEEIVKHELTQFESWLESRRLEPAIRSLRSALDNACQRELSHLREELSDEDFNRMESLLRKVVNRMLHKSTNEIRQSSTELERNFLSRLESFFQLDASELEDQQ
ncbi:MAG: glutamyl-tRNA reductase [Planctomycetia bacterium]|nr:glutamyl-tRNA reductase [Planctomycetia bacterium]NCF98810.1 glutamyl-tRNA reductase [Planctomycetia bacterium]